MNFPDSKTVERIRKEYPVGCRIVLDEMDDPYRKVRIGSQGTVTGVDDTGTVMPAWDEGGSLGILYEADRCHKIRTEEEAVVTLNHYGKRQPEEYAICPRCGQWMSGKTTTHALSRYANIMVCDACGMAEALEKAGLAKALPLMKWACIKGPQEGEGPWKG